MARPDPRAPAADLDLRELRLPEDRLASRSARAAGDAAGPCRRLRLRAASPTSRSVPAAVPSRGLGPPRRRRHPGTRRRPPVESRQHRPAAKPDGAGREADRRQVTVLFADLSGFTSLAERLDPEEVRAFQNALFETLAAGDRALRRLRREIRRRRGDGGLRRAGRARGRSGAGPRRGARHARPRRRAQRSLGGAPRPAA